MRPHHEAMIETYTTTTISVREIAKQHGISYQRVYQILAKYKVARRPRTSLRQDKHMRDWIDRWCNDHTLERMAWRTEYTVAQVRLYLHQEHPDRKRVYSTHSTYSRSERDAWVAEYKRGDSCAAIASSRAVSQMTVHRHMVAVGCSRRYGRGKV